MHDDASRKAFLCWFGNRIFIASKSGRVYKACSSLWCAQIANHKLCVMRENHSISTSTSEGLDACQCHGTRLIMNPKSGCTTSQASCLCLAQCILATPATSGSLRLRTWHHVRFSQNPCTTHVVQWPSDLLEDPGFLGCVFGFVVASLRVPLRNVHLRGHAGIIKEESILCYKWKRREKDIH